jgi:hypothetical protein
MESQEGGCLCGAIRYRVTGSPLYSVVCHCASCRKAAAAPSVAWQTYARAHFVILSGTPRIYRSSPGVERCFCECCGSPLTYRNEQRPTEVDITTVSLDDPEANPPNRELWVQDRLSWQMLDPSRHQYPAGGE